MGARNDLNEIYVTGSVVLAAVVGGMAQSWVAFVIALAIMLATFSFTTKIR